MFLRNIQCWLVLFLLLCLTHIVWLRNLSDVRPGAESSTFFPLDPFVWVPTLYILRKVLSTLQGRQPRYFSLIKCLLLSFISRIFPVRLRYSFLTSFLSCLFNGIRFKYSLVIMILLLSKRSDVFRLLLSLFTHFRVFYTSGSRWFLAGVWVTASILKSSGLSSVFCPIFKML